MTLSGRKPSITREQYARIKAARAARLAVPTVKQLARELGLPLYIVKTYSGQETLRNYESATQEQP